jgi:hypothetical protein
LGKQWLDLFQNRQQPAIKLFHISSVDSSLRNWGTATLDEKSNLYGDDPGLGQAHGESD